MPRATTLANTSYVCGPDMSGSANKAKGSRWEADIENYANEAGVKARRLPRAGAKDIGDVAIELKNGHVLVLEAKNTKTHDMAQYLREAEIEAGHYEDKYKTVSYGLVITKTRQKDAGEGRVTMTFDTLINLLNWEGLS